MNLSKIIALVAAVSTISISATVAAQPLREGEIRTLPCEYSTGSGLILVVRGERVGEENGRPIIGQRIIETRSCTSATAVESIPVRPSLASVLAMPRDRARVACNEAGQTVLVRSDNVLGTENEKTVVMAERRCRAG
jgi:hypothetical protein